MWKASEVGMNNKEQPEYEGDSRTNWWWVCGECHGPICDVDKFCRHCGREIEWNEQEKRNKKTAAGSGWERTVSAEACAERGQGDGSREGMAGEGGGAAGDGPEVPASGKAQGNAKELIERIKFIKQKIKDNPFKMPYMEYLIIGAFSDCEETLKDIESESNKDIKTDFDTVFKALDCCFCDNCSECPYDDAEHCERLLMLEARNLTEEQNEVIKKLRVEIGRAQPVLEKLIGFFGTADYDEILPQLDRILENAEVYDGTEVPASGKA